MIRPGLSSLFTLAALALVLLGGAAMAAGCSSKPASDGGGEDPGTQDPLWLVPDDGSPGAQAINKRACGKCHNEEGGGVMAGRMTILPDYSSDVELFPPNLTPDPTTGIGNWTDGQLLLAIRHGIDWDSANLCPQMDHYRTMPDEEANAIIAYLRSLPAVKKEIPRSICPPLKRKDD